MSASCIVLTLHVLCIVTLLQLSPVLADTTSAASVASQYSLTTSTVLAFPTSTLSVENSVDFIVSDWSLSKGHVQNGNDSLQFVDDPFPNNTVPVTGDSSPSGPVLQVTYPAGSFNNNTGGGQFVNLWNSTTPFQSMLVSYELAFDQNFDWVKGGKLPGIKGGPDVTGCSGGKVPNGTDCFSARLMWRKNGAGEVYAYIPISNGICDQSGITCNDDFGTSIQRGSFTFPSGQWSRVSLLVQLNNPSESNGYVGLYFNDILTISQKGVQFRNSSDVDAIGLFFSTFFGGNDDSWATPVDTHTYFRNFRMWGSGQPSTLSSAATTGRSSLTEWGWVVFVAVIIFFCGIELV